MGYVKYWRILTLIYGDDALGVLHSQLVLHGAGYCHVEYYIWLYRDAALADLLFMGEPSVIYKRAGAGHLTAQKLCKLTKLI